MSGTPTAQVMIETYLVGRHELGIKIVYVTGDPNDPANKGYRVYYKVVAPGSAAPTAPGELIKSYYTKRKKDVMEFEFGDSGKTVFFCRADRKRGPERPLGADGERPHPVTAAVSAYAVHIILTAGILNEVSREDRSRLKSACAFSAKEFV
jgi:hypothetical protein